MQPNDGTEVTLPDAEIDHQSQLGPNLPAATIVVSVRFRERPGFTAVLSRLSIKHFGRRYRRRHGKRRIRMRGEAARPS